MASNIMGRSNPNIIEVTGKPGAVWGAFPIPLRGEITLKIAGDVIQASLVNGLSKTTTRIRAQNIDTVETMEAPNYFLLALGGFLTFVGGIGILGALTSGHGFGGIFFLLLLYSLFAGGGVLLVRYTLNNKYRLLTFRSPCCTIPIFMTKPSDSYQQFSNNVLILARQLNAQPVQASNRTSQARQGVRP